MIVVTGGIKGGSGKTTLATNLVVLKSQEQKSVLLIDADDQKSASDWVEHRESLNIPTDWTTVQLHGISVRNQVEKLMAKYDEIIIDTGGRDTASQRSALTIADILLVPFQPRSLDIWTLGKLSSLIQEVLPINPNLQAFSFINRGDPKGKDNQESMELLNESDVIQCLPFVLGQRKAFSNAAAEGLSIFELKAREKKAIQEMGQLINFIYKKTKVTPLRYHDS